MMFDAIIAACEHEYTTLAAYAQHGRTISGGDFMVFMSTDQGYNFDRLIGQVHRRVSQSLSEAKKS